MRRDPDEIVLDVLIHHELAGLRPPGAPPTLLPRIMAAVQAWASRPWYQRAWFTWPVYWQAVAILLLSTFATAAIFGAEAAQRIVAGALTGTADQLGPSLSRATAVIAVMSNVAGALLEAALVYRAYAFSFVVAVGAACAMLAAVLQHISAERTQVS